MVNKLIIPIKGTDIKGRDTIVPKNLRQTNKSC